MYNVRVRFKQQLVQCVHVYTRVVEASQSLASAETGSNEESKEGYARSHYALTERYKVITGDGNAGLKAITHYYTCATT